MTTPAAARESQGGPLQHFEQHEAEDWNRRDVHQAEVRAGSRRHEGTESEQQAAEERGAGVAGAPRANRNIA